MEVGQSRSTRTNRNLVLDSPQTMTISSASRGLLCTLHLELIGVRGNDRTRKTPRNGVKVEEGIIV